MKFLYVVRDKLAEDVGDQIMVCRADAVAVRAFTDALQNPQSYMAKHPQDYELLEVGALHHDGRIEAIESPRIVLTGQQWKDMQEAAAAANTGV